MDNNVRPIDMRPYLVGVWGGCDRFEPNALYRMYEVLND